MMICSILIFFYNDVIIYRAGVATYLAPFFKQLYFAFINFETASRPHVVPTIIIHMSITFVPGIIFPHNHAACSDYVQFKYINEREIPSPFPVNAKYQNEV